ncbi:MAG: YeeE/YedE family protein [Deltaproteobacteria bacterium]|nr:YeeE/YedE family protein [Deltaproteobacteria bacterium]
MMPFYQTGGFDYPVAMLLATVLGMGFGFVLERAGFGRADVLVAQFHGTDMRVLKVMFTAIATAAVGIGLLSGVGALDLSKVVVPQSFIWPQIIGGLLLGVGFVVSGYCPGTAVVAAGSGHIDALYSLGGVMVGSLLFGFVYPLVEGLYEAGGMGVVTFPDLLGVPWPVVAIAVAVMAVGSFVLAERLEKRYAKKASIAPPPGSPRARNRTLGGLLAVAAAALFTMLMPDAKVVASEAPRAPTSIDALTLARGLVAEPEAYWLVDLRAPTLCQAGSLPGAMCLPADDPGADALVAGLAPTRTLVLFGDGDLPFVPAAAARYEGPVRALAGGLAGFRAAVLTAPLPPTEATPEALSAYRLRAALHQRFTGAKAKVEAPAPTVKPVTRPTKKGGGC